MNDTYTLIVVTERAKVQQTTYQGYLAESSADQGFDTAMKNKEVVFAVVLVASVPGETGQETRRHFSRYAKT